MALHIGAETVLFDADDHDLVEKYRWTIGTHGYATTGSGKAQMLFHRLVMSLTDGQIVDHINRNKLDNRKRNLRICSASQNSYNNKQQSNSKSGYRGVVQNNLGKWCAYINNLGHSIYLGMYDTPEEAANAYDSAAAIIAGEFAYRNLPDVPLRPDILLDLESKRRKGRLQPNEYDVILSLHEQGLSQNEIARRIERSVASVQRVIKRGKYKPWQRKDSQQQERIPQKRSTGILDG